MNLIDTQEKMAKRQAELDAPEIARLHRMSKSGRRMGDIILQGKFGIDTDYEPGFDDGEPPAQERE